MFYSQYNSPLGKIYMFSDGEQLTKMAFEGQKYFSFDEKNFVENNDLEVFKEVKEFLDKYFSGQKVSFDQTLLKPSGSVFQMEVYRELLNIEYGKTLTYKDIALKLAYKHGKRMSARAVGNAVAKNPIIILIPCHRVLGQNGKITGYSAGTDKKIRLLKIENIAVIKE